MTEIVDRMSNTIIEKGTREVEIDQRDKPFQRIITFNYD